MIFTSYVYSIVKKSPIKMNCTPKEMKNVQYVYHIILSTITKSK